MENMPEQEISEPPEDLGPIRDLVDEASVKAAAAGLAGYLVVMAVEP